MALGSPDPIELITRASEMPLKLSKNQKAPPKAELFDYAQNKFRLYSLLNDGWITIMGPRASLPGIIQTEERCLEERDLIPTPINGSGI